MSEAPTKRTYKKTLNLPKTSFPMRAGLARREPEVAGVDYPTAPVKGPGHAPRSKRKRR